jgi:hypothetical protein
VKARNADHVFRYNEAMATVRRHPSVEHQFSLVITRVYEEGDQELLEDEDESEWHPPSYRVYSDHGVQPMKKGHSSSDKSFNSGPANTKDSPALSGAIFMATSMNFTNLWLPTPMSRPRLSLKSACIEPCMR